MYLHRHEKGSAPFNDEALGYFLPPVKYIYVLPVGNNKSTVKEKGFSVFRIEEV